MNGTLANSAAIVVGGGLGLLARGSISERYRSITVQAVALSVMLVGLQMAFQAKNLLVVIASMALGGLLGELLAIERGLERLGERVKRWARRDDSGFTAGFVSASLIFCVGSMAVVGSIEDGARGNPQILYAKAFIDGVFAVAATASMGAGVIFSSLPVLLYQGGLTLLAGYLGAGLPGAVVDGMSATGGLLIFSIGANVLGITRIRVGNLLPAIFLAGLLSGYW